MNNEKLQVFPPFCLVAQFADGSRLTFDGLTEEQALDRITAATHTRGDVVWYDGVTDQHYEKGKYYKLIPESGARVIGIDLTEYDGPPPSGDPPADEE